MVQRNPHTGAALSTGVASDEYRSNYDNIFRKKEYTAPSIKWENASWAMRYSIDEFSKLFTAGVFTSDDGIGYYGDDDGYFLNHTVFEMKPIPKWAKYIAWIPK